MSCVNCIREGMAEKKTGYLDTIMELLPELTTVELHVLRNKIDWMMR